MHADQNGEGGKSPLRIKTFHEVRSAGSSPCLLWETRRRELKALKRRESMTVLRRTLNTYRRNNRPQTLTRYCRLKRPSSSIHTSLTRYPAFSASLANPAGVCL